MRVVANVKEFLMVHPEVCVWVWQWRQRLNQRLEATRPHHCGTQVVASFAVVRAANIVERLSLKTGAKRAYVFTNEEST